MGRRGFFIFYFRFLQKYIFVFKIYKNIPGRPAAGRPGPGRPATGRQGLFYKKIREIFAEKPLEDQSPGSQTAGPGHPATGRPAPPPLYKGWLVSPLLICITKIPETKKKEGERERGEALPDFRAGDCK